MPRILSSQRSQRIGKLLFLFIISLALAGGILVLADTQFRVRTIKLEGLPKGQALYGLDSTYNQHMFFLDGDKIADSLKSTNPPVMNVRVDKIYPDTLLLKITLYRPAIYLSADTGFLQLSSDGRVLQRMKDGELSDLPVLHYYEKISYDSTQPGAYLSMKDILMAIYFSEKTKELGMRVNTIDIDGVDMIGLNLDGKVILFSSEKDKELQVYQMEQIVHQFRIEGKNFTKMDLRFNQPILELTQ